MIAAGDYSGFFVDFQGKARLLVLGCKKVWFVVLW
jgi:hypothetical protein